MSENNDNGNGGGSPLSDKVAIAALVIAVVAFITTIVQLLQTILDSATGLPNCDARVMGKWARHTSRKFRWKQLRLEVDFDAPVIFLAPKDNTKGPVQGAEIWYADGSKKSCQDMRVEEPVPEGQDDNVFSTGMIREPVHTVDSELATWVTLLRAIQKMERYSNNWETRKWHYAKSPRPAVPPVTLAIGVQSKKRSFDANPTVKKPYATTTICHMIELAATLGLYWKEFNRDQSKYRAEGNGYSLLGTRNSDFGIVFIFEKTGFDSFQENRIIPTSEVKELCFGNVPSFYRRRDRAEDEAWNAPFKEQRELQTLQLGSRREIADTLGLIGCNTNTQLYFARDGHKHIHLFSVTFELLGMLGRTLHIMNRAYTYLPNPIVYPWNRQSFSLRRMLDEFHNHLVKDIDTFSREGFQLPSELERVNATAANLNKLLPKYEEYDFTPLQLDSIHEAINTCDDLLAPMVIDKTVVMDVLRRHLQVVLEAINTTAEQAAGTHPHQGSPVSRSDISFDNLLKVPPERREFEFMKKYFTEVRFRVIITEAAGSLDPQAADASRQIHRESPQQQMQSSHEHPNGQLRTTRPDPPATVAAEDLTRSPIATEDSHPSVEPDTPQSEAASTTPPAAARPAPAPLRTDTRGLYPKRAGTMALQRASTFGNFLDRPFEVRRNNVWCTLVLRMICWLLLHNFDKKDTQVSKSELIGSRQSVYIM